MGIAVTAVVALAAGYLRGGFVRGGAWVTGPPIRSASPGHGCGAAPGGRSDRLLHEAEASGGDPRRICDLFGLTVGAALRYTSTVEQAGLVEYNLRNAGPRPKLRGDNGV
ncbi:hypothetical protein ACGFSD_07365 [Streptomyces caniferus]|uniref:hypothetical protein n=1 Tax=Streptomyces caniferus TaxID=285557 RepID=UPI0033F52439